jgi:PHP family Zn ribbon phosphoesterase
MDAYRADLHIHTVLSPCGDLEMSPVNIIERAAEIGLQVIAVTDHNHAGHAKLTRRLGSEKGIWVVYGVELTTKEEVHCLAFFDTDDQLDLLQDELNRKLPKVTNDPSLLGHQVIVDEKEQILQDISHSLIPGLNMEISEAARMVHDLGGLFVPAHVDRKTNGLYAQLGIFPDGLEVDAVEVSWRNDPTTFVESHPELSRYTLIQGSDAHFIHDVGRTYCNLMMKERSFAEFRKAFKGVQGRKVILA